MSTPKLAALTLCVTLLGACSGVGAGDASLGDAGLDAGASLDAFDAGDTALDAWGPDLELGTGLTSFELLPPSDGRLELVAGPQGGWHVYLSMRVRRFEPSGLTYRVTRVSDGALLAELGLGVREGTFLPSGDALERAGDQVILRLAAPSDVVGSEVLVEGAIYDTTAASRMASVRALVVDEAP